MKTEKIAVLAITDKTNKLIGVIHFIGTAHTFYSCDRMNMDSISSLLSKCDLPIEMEKQ